MGFRRQPEASFTGELSSSLSRRALLRRAGLLGIAVPMLTGLLAACGGEEAEPTPATDTAPSGSGSETPTAAAASPGTSTGGSASGQAQFQVEEPRSKGGQLVEGAFSDAKTVNPVLVSDTSSGRIADLIFNGVMTADVQTAEPTGKLADSWEISEDGLTYSFTLRDGVTFHDGEALTAEDVRFTFELMLDPDTKSPRTSVLAERIDSIEVVDDRNITFTLKQPNAAFLVSNMGYGIVPRHILQDVAPADIAEHEFSTGAKGVTIGTGPFMFEEWVKDDHVTLVKNPDYWEGEPNLDRYIFKVVPDQTVIVQQLKTGELDFGAITEPSYEEMQQQEHINVVAYDDFTFTYAPFQLDPEKTTLFQQKEVRQALMYALDRQGMIDAIRFGLGEVAIGTIPKLSWAYSPDGIELKYEYDPDKAAALLDEAGWVPGPDGIREKDGQRLSFTVYTNSGNNIREQYITVFQEAWRKIGVEAFPKTEEWNAFLDRKNVTHDFELVLLGFSWGVDPDQTTMWACNAYGGGFNANKYCNEELDKLMRQALETTDQEERKRIYTECQNILMEDLPTMVLDFPKSIAAVNKRVHNLFPNAVNTVFNAHQWWVDG